MLTRLPAPHRLAAPDAVALLDSNFIEQGRVVALDAGAYRALSDGHRAMACAAAARTTR